VLGLPPTWYKEPAYRSRVVREPRAVLGEFGLFLPEGVDLRVWDSSAEVRYLVLPQRPAGSGGLSESELAALVTRDSMIGTGQPAAPGGGTCTFRDPTTWQAGNWQDLNGPLQRASISPFGWAQSSFADRFMRRRDEFWVGVTYQF
jgi:hypothetical protein